MESFSKAEKAKVKGKFESFKHGNFSTEDTENMLHNTDDILNKSSKSPLAKYFDDIKTMCAMVKAWAKKEFREVSGITIGLIILTLLYVISPIGIIPDCIPVIGFIDDALMVALCLAAVKKDIEVFKNWLKVHA